MSVVPVRAADPGGTRKPRSRRVGSERQDVPAPFGWYQTGLPEGSYRMRIAEAAHAAQRAEVVVKERFWRSGTPRAASPSMVPVGE